MQGQNGEVRFRMARAEAADQRVQRRFAGAIEFGAAIVVGADAAQDRRHEGDHAAGGYMREQSVRRANGVECVGQKQAGNVGIGHLAEWQAPPDHDAGVQEQQIE